jgi:hypothetical protein
MRVSAIVRGWIAFAAVGAGLIHLALVISAPLLGGVLLAGVGILEFAWGVMVMFDERFLVPRLAVVAVLAPIGLWIAAVVLDAESFRPFPLAISSLLELFIALALAISLRRPREPRSVGTRRYVLGLTAGALVVGLLTGPALGATEAAHLVTDPNVFDTGVHH